MSTGGVVFYEIQGYYQVTFLTILEDTGIRLILGSYYLTIFEKENFH